MVSSSDSNFWIDFDGTITSMMSFDYESLTTNPLTFTVTISDFEMQSASADVTITVNNIAEAPVFPSTPYSFTIAEDAAWDAVVGTVTATDPQNDAMYSILPGDDAWMFTIDSVTGELKLASSLNYESATSHTITVQAADMSGEAPATTTVTINVTDVAEAPVWGATGGPYSISEMAHTGHLVTSIPVSDPQGDVINITIYQGDINADPSTWNQTDTFSAQVVNGNAELRVDNEWNLDHETMPQHNLILKADDMMGNTATVAVTVDLTDEVEWGAMGIFVISWEVQVLNNNTGSHHAEILIIPEAQPNYASNPLFGNFVWVNREKVRYTTVGAGPQGLFTLQLVSTANRSSIDEDRWVQRGQIVANGYEEDLINGIFALDANYGDNLNYVLFPDPAPATGWNSNSYAHGLLNAIQESGLGWYWVDFGEASFPGWNKPLALTEFE